MKICDSINHEDIAYEGGRHDRLCPLCEAIDQIEALEKEVKELQKEMESHECKPE